MHCKDCYVAVQKVFDLVGFAADEEMAREGLTGTRIRERRVIAGLKQADLARQIGISASYLNLIEHNRRRIGGKLLLSIAAALNVEPVALTEGAEAQLIAALREAAEDANLAPQDAERAEDFAGRFPGWANVLADAHRRISTLERTIETLSDRLAHDPELAASMHEVLTTAAAIRSTAAILVDDKTLDAQWRDRFHANIDADSRRLAESSKALVSYLDSDAAEADSASSPREQVEVFLESQDYVFEALEAGDTTVDALIQASEDLSTAASRHIAKTVLERIVDDSALLPRDALRRAVAELGPDPAGLAHHFNLDAACVMRRLASIAELNAGLVVCDRSGSLLFRKAVSGFAIPRYGSACPLWPLFEALSLPGHLLSRRVRASGRGEAVFQCYAVSETTSPAAYNAAPLTVATMLVLPVSDTKEDSVDAIVGSSCRVCTRSNCAGRREPSILSDGF